MTNLARLVAVPVLVASLAACGSENGPTPLPSPTPPPRAVVAVLIDPNPVVAVPSGNASFPWDFRFNLQVSDSGGVAFVVSSMQTTITSRQSGLALISTDTNPFVGVRISGGGQETRQFHIGPYRMENFAKEGRVNIKMNFIDDNGNASVFDGTVNIVHADGPVRLDR